MYDEDHLIPEQHWSEDNCVAVSACADACIYICMRVNACMYASACAWMHMCMDACLHESQWWYRTYCERFSLFYMTNHGTALSGNHHDAQHERTSRPFKTSERAGSNLRVSTNESLTSRLNHS